MSTTNAVVNTSGEMWLYLWEDVDDTNECKFGEKFVDTGKSPEKEIQKRIRESLGVRKDRFDEGKIKIISTWNVATLAASVQKNYKGAHMDDWVRDRVGYRKGTRGEVHSMSGDDFAILVNNELSRLGSPLPLAHLSQPQATELLSVKHFFEAGCKTVLAELCARFGKTIWSGALTKEMETDVTIVATYVQTVTTSFAKDLTSFQQWSDYVHVDTKDEYYQDVVINAINNNKKVIAYLSLCHSTKRQERVEFLAELDASKMLIVDEADFGAHQKKQVDALVPLRDCENTKILLMTGTNGDRASKLWSPDAAVSVVYPELLVAKSNTPKKVPSPYSVDGITNFKVDESRHLLYSGVSLYQADLTSVVKYSLQQDPELFSDGKANTDILPSWSKFVANPIKAKGFFVNMLRSAFLGQLSLDDMNVDLQVGVSQPRVRMMFLPGSTKNENMKHIVELAKQTLGVAWKVVPLYGNVTTNRKSEKDAKEAVSRANKDGNNVLILSAGMAQRSFSVGEIEEIYLAYDSGDVGATIQKMSRALTPNGSTQKTGKVISLSFDPNRDDKFDSVMLEAAKNLAQKTDQDIDSALRSVFKSVDLFKFTDDGAAKINKDQYLKDILDARRISRVIGASADLSILKSHELSLLAEGDGSYFKQARVEAAAKGKTYQQKKSTQKNKNTKNASEKMIKKVREVITNIAENVDIIVMGTGSKNISEAIQVVDSDASFRSDVESEFSVSFDMIAYLFESGVINRNLADLVMDKN